jgi:hypothetical protein
MEAECRVQRIHNDNLSRPILHLFIPAAERSMLPSYLTRWLPVLALLPFLVIPAGCTHQTSQTAREYTDSRSSNKPWRNLAGDERRGGHTLKRHVGKSDMELRARLASEPNISAASAYNDTETAQSAVGEVIEANQARIEQWLHRPGGHPNLVLDYNGRQSIGQSLRRNAGISQPCSHAVVVLKWVSNDDFIVLTSYPECR